MHIAAGGEVEIINLPYQVCLQWDSNDGFGRLFLNKSEALELAAELVKLAMPDAKSETVSIM
jgi:hypothetical protein